MTVAEEKWGLIVVDPDRTVFGELATSDGRITLLGSQVNKAAENNWKHSPDSTPHNYFVDVAESSTHMFLDDNGRFRPDLRGILLGGYGTWKEFMFREAYFPAEIQKWIVTKLIETGDVTSSPERVRGLPRQERSICGDISPVLEGGEPPSLRGGGVRLGTPTWASVPARVATLLPGGSCFFGATRPFRGGGSVSTGVDSPVPPGTGTGTGTEYLRLANPPTSRGACARRPIVIEQARAHDKLTEEQRQVAMMRERQRLLKE